MKCTVYILWLLIFFAHIASGQTKCADKALHKSYLLARTDKYFSAINVLKNTLNKYPDCATTHCRLAELYYRTNQLDNALVASRTAIAINEAEGISAANALLDIIISYKEDSIANLFATNIFKSSVIKDTLSLNGNMQLVNHKEALSFKTNPTNASITNLTTKINDGASNFFPHLTLDGNTMVFTKIKDGANEDFYISTFDTCNGWQAPKNMGYPPNTSMPEGAPRLSSDGYYFFFTRCDSRSLNGWDGGGCDIIFCYKEDDSTWSSPQKFGATINSPGYEGQPCLSSNNKDMYFVSDREGGFGGKDIWRSSFIDGYWQKPINLGSSINSSADEEAPFIHPDNNTLYFASNGRKGLGGRDFFLARKINDSAWTNAINLGYPINTNGEEASIYVTAMGNEAYISRAPYKSSYYTICTATLPKLAQPAPTHCIKGKVYDKFNGLLFKNQRLHIYDSNMNLLQTFISNSGDASFAFPLPSNNKYILRINNMESYRTFEEVIDLTKKNNVTANIYFDIAMKLPELYDTLYKSTVTHLIDIDTQLYHVYNNIQSWKKFKADSLVVYLSFAQNIFVDTALKDAVCFSDTGLINYNKWIDSVQLQNDSFCNFYFEFYKHYLAYCGLKKEQIVINKLPFWQRKKSLWNIEINVVEFY